MEFNYLEDDLIDWANYASVLTDAEVRLLEKVRDHYIPEFEAAIWRLAAESARSASSLLAAGAALSDSEAQ